MALVLQGTVVFPQAPELRIPDVKILYYFLIPALLSRYFEGVTNMLNCIRGSVTKLRTDKSGGAERKAHISASPEPFARSASSFSMSRSMSDHHHHPLACCIVIAHHLLQTIIRPPTIVLIPTRVIWVLQHTQHFLFVLND